MLSCLASFLLTLFSLLFLCVPSLSLSLSLFSALYCSPMCRISCLGEPGCEDASGPYCLDLQCALGIRNVCWSRVCGTPTQSHEAYKVRHMMLISSNICGNIASLLLLLLLLLLLPLPFLFLTFLFLSSFMMGCSDSVGFFERKSTADYVFALGIARFLACASWILQVSVSKRASKPLSLSPRLFCIWTPRLYFTLLKLLYL